MLADLGLVAVIATQTVDFGAERLRICLLNAGASLSRSHRLVVVLLLGATLSGCLSAVRSASHRGNWTSATLILGFPAIAEITSLHATIDSVAWGKALYAPVLIALAVSLSRISSGSSQNAVLRADLATLLASYSIHLFGPDIVAVLGWGPDSWAFAVTIAVKEGAELAEWILVFVSVARLSTTRRLC